MRDRIHPTGVPEVTSVASSLAPGARVLDVGCGNGLPITRVLLDAGHRVVGLDSSREMLTRFRANLPNTPAIRGLVQDCAFIDRVFDAAVAWGVIFHLTQTDQAKAFAAVSHVLREGALFLFTAGDAEDVEGGSVGTMNGVTFHYFSFSIDGYRSLLRKTGFRLVDVHKDAGENTYYLAQKSR
jgi:cyclopropane fatty-acyl-phospholipid synthase-like methyltransferase